MKITFARLGALALTAALASLAVVLGTSAAFDEVNDKPAPLGLIGMTQEQPLRLFVTYISRLRPAAVSVRAACLKVGFVVELDHGFRRPAPLRFASLYVTFLRSRRRSATRAFASMFARSSTFCMRVSGVPRGCYRRAARPRGDQRDHRLRLGRVHSTRVSRGEGAMSTRRKSGSHCLLWSASRSWCSAIAAVFTLINLLLLIAIVGEQMGLFVPAQTPLDCNGERMSVRRHAQRQSRGSPRSGPDVCELRVPHPVGRPEERRGPSGCRRSDRRRRQRHRRARRAVHGSPANDRHERLRPDRRADGRHACSRAERRRGHGRGASRGNSCQGSM